MKKRILDVCTCVSVVGLSCLFVGMATGLRSLIVIGVAAWFFVVGACVLCYGQPK